jgi:hypothetical protein
MQAMTRNTTTFHSIQYFNGVQQKFIQHKAMLSIP